MPLADVDHLSDCEPLEEAMKKPSTAKVPKTFKPTPKFGRLKLDGTVDAFKPGSWPFRPRKKLVIKLDVKKPRKDAKLPRKGKLVCGKSLTLSGFGTIRCFSATTQANTKFLSVRGSRDFATQVFHWVDYKKAVRDAQQVPGKFVTPELGEWLHGIPLGWSNPEPDSVQQDPKLTLPWLTSCPHRYRVVSLFAGILGLDLGLSRWVHSIGFVENNPYCRKVIASRIQDGFFNKDSVVHDDVTTFKMSQVEHLSPDGLIGGWPCQGASKAGKKLALKDKRTALLTEIFRLWDSAPYLKFMILENVGNVLGKDMVEILEYIKQAAMRRCLDLRWASVTGHMVGAPVWRERTFFMFRRVGFIFFKAMPYVVPNEDLKTWPQNDWSESVKPPLKSWLATSSTPLARDRLKAVGNLVMPRVAYMAVNIIGHHHLEEGEPSLNAGLMFLLFKIQAMLILAWLDRSC
ncbi:unnamed protein product [Durusdinium trenchii]|uniref:Uncharacterized protein n=2 Tax=Durusdinium trenchii TaxID=1381693 RepID=A0ABP0SFX3_9DINO